MPNRSNDRSLPAPNGDLRRRHRRVSLLWSGQLQDADRRGSSCAILNLSNGGARLRLAESRDYPPRVELECARFGRLAAKVVWHRGNEVGLAFLEAPKALAAMLGGSLQPAMASA